MFYNKVHKVENYDLYTIDTEVKALSTHFFILVFLVQHLTEIQVISFTSYLCRHSHCFYVNRNSCQIVKLKHKFQQLPSLNLLFSSILLYYYNLRVYITLLIELRKFISFQIAHYSRIYNIYIFKNKINKLTSFSESTYRFEKKNIFRLILREF